VPYEFPTTAPNAAAIRAGSPAGRPSAANATSAGRMRNLPACCSVASSAAVVA
jgi:hypothetical protein